MPAAVSPIARPSVGRTFIVAISVLGCIALSQIAAVSWVFVKRFTDLTERAKLGPARIAEAAAAPVSGDLAFTATLDARDPFEEARAAVTTDPIAPPQKPMPVSSAKLNPQAPPETRYQELVLQGKQLRERGDTGAALVKQREAMALEPQNPEAIFEMAVTFERMSLMDKAAEQWKRIFDMGEAAGSFYIAAESRMKMSQAQALAAVQSVQGVQGVAPAEAPLSTLKADAMLGVGEIARQEKTESGGTRFALKVPVKARPGEKVSVADVDIHVLFYDIVDAKTTVQTSADVSYRWASSPIDWAGVDPEFLEVEYSAQPPLAKAAKAEKREYYGYIVRVYYKGALQDLRAEPGDLNTKFPASPTLDTTPPSKK
ncbi:MAG: hypothetical protein ABMA13_03750 [Chthoniobacteraceae bacterium]